MNNKYTIDTYTTIYPIRIDVCKGNITLEQLKKLYTYGNGSSITEEVLKGYCTTSTCNTNDKDRHKVLLVKINDIDDSDILTIVNVVSHEAVHCALDIYGEIGQRVYNTSSEPFAYLVSYITECIYKTFSKK